ncbi:hypothetical protein PAHAL_4G251400 [Panicum hallii]|uniref:Uncharacterized protein n=1 Tax=Panicum hallii TaxID=206008 RepID=A0A2S3HLC3_9POAL|nr:hypothetical protein PAHAL_4G251400 [Panicum hallii]
MDFSRELKGLDLCLLCSESSLLVPGSQSKFRSLHITRSLDMYLGSMNHFQVQVIIDINLIAEAQTKEVSEFLLDVSDIHLSSVGTEYIYYLKFMSHVADNCYLPDHNL